MFHLIFIKELYAIKISVILQSIDIINQRGLAFYQKYPYIHLNHIKSGAYF